MDANLANGTVIGTIVGGVIAAFRVAERIWPVPVKAPANGNGNGKCPLAPDVDAIKKAVVDSDGIPVSTSVKMNREIMQEFTDALKEIQHAAELTAQVQTESLAEIRRMQDKITSRT